MDKAPPTHRSGTAAVSNNGMDPDQVVRLQKLKIWRKLREGNLHLITKANVEELFMVLDSEDQGDLSKEDLLLLRQVPGVSLTEDDIYAIADDCDKDNSGRISCDELYKAMTEGELAFSMMKEQLGKNQKPLDEKQLELSKVIEFLSAEYETSSALWSLPQTLLLFSVFLILMSAHLDLTRAYEMQKALQNEIDGEGPPYLRNHEWAIVHDIPTMWEWMNSSFVSLNFKNDEGDLGYFPYPGRVASYNQMIGGVRLVKTQVIQPQPCEQSDALLEIYDTRTGGMCHRSNNIEEVNEYIFYHESLTTIHDHLGNLSADMWLDQNASVMDVHTLFYNAHLGAFTDAHLTFNFLESGLVKIVLDMETFGSDPYYNMLWCIPDVIFVFILIRMLWNETQEILPAARSGLDGLIGYMEFWNIVDWCSIVLGGVVMGFWAQICFGISGSIQTLTAEFPKPTLDGMVFANQTYLTEAELAAVVDRTSMEDNLLELHQTSLDIASTHEALRNLVFWYNFVLMLKFFKAFQANPRLDIVIRTLTKSAVEIIHFLIVFLVIFLVFSSAGYVVFGETITGFRDQYQSVTFCWAILMGDFDMPAMELVNYYYTHIWMFCFQFMVLLILLNMLLAIIMDTYVAAKQEAGDPTEQLTIWTQIKDACYTVRETRGHIKLYDLLLELQDDEYPAHPNPICTSKSLRRAFAKMSKHQADYIMRKTVEHFKAKANEIDIGLSDTVRVLSLLKVNVLRTAAVMDEMFTLVKAQSQAAQSKTFENIMSGAEEELEREQHQQKMIAMTTGIQPSYAVNATMPSLPGMHSQASMRGGQSLASLNSSIAPLPHGNSTFSDYGNSRANTSHSHFPPPPPMAMPMPLPAVATSPGDVAAGGAAQLPPGTAEMLTMLSQISQNQQMMMQEQQRLMSNVEEQLAENRKYVEERDSWFETRMAALDRRCEKLYLASEKTLAVLQGVDFSELMEVPRHIEQLLPKRLPNGSYRQARGHTYSFSSSVEGSSAAEDDFVLGAPPSPSADGGAHSSRGPSADSSPSPARPVFGGHSAAAAAAAAAASAASASPAGASSVGHGMSQGLAKKLEKQLESIQKQLDEIVTYTVEGPEQRKMLWKVDLGVRQIRQEQKELPAAVASLVGQPPEHALGKSTQGKRAMLAARQSERMPTHTQDSTILREAAAGHAMQGVSTVSEEPPNGTASMSPHERLAGIGRTVLGS